MLTFLEIEKVTEQDDNLQIQKVLYRKKGNIYDDTYPLSHWEKVGVSKGFKYLRVFEDSEKSRLVVLI